MNSPDADPSLDRFVAEARSWLERNAKRRVLDVDQAWGVGHFDASVFHDLSDDEEVALLQDLKAWQQVKFDAGYGAIDWPGELGGAGLTRDHERAFSVLELEYETPIPHETFSVTRDLVAPTIREFGTPAQRERFLRRFVRTEDLCCQLFSEPEAGSDLAGLRSRAQRDGGEWVINGQKVWSSGARFATWGELICRTDPDASKHAGLTAFIVPMDSPGITIRPIRQMSGGTSFTEVFFDDVRIPNSLRLGEIGDGWTVTLRTLAFERSSSGHNRDVGGSWSQVLGLARAHERTDESMTRQRLAQLYSLDRIRGFAGQRADEQSDGDARGALGSLGKLQWTQWLTAVSGTASALLGPMLTADTGRWGTFGWTEHVLGAPGYRIAGGSDEIQRNIIGERVLGLPPEPKVDHDVPYSAARHSAETEQKDDK
jgi:alkylation response protein AidB-like acyl-CoA dehydrogenase